ncbi:hypothetical protein AB835_05710 [Candidatus Endobugula sertula]|uniref:Uncharacterized protein n=1 Tax=Candidatus Endobugula sertula TaxID=62101 RepID=A0A1D2QR14_9GAMM|nr:hypothetical protein AB835_05710 [Candidatus Endobugula sertula]
MDTQQKNIKKTVFLLIVAMVTILALFLHKITTPRYLSNIELKINGLVMLEDKQKLNFVSDKLNESWILIAADKEDRQRLEALLQMLKPYLRKKVTIVDRSEVVATFTDDIIPVVRPSGKYLAYFKPPYEQHKMLLTLSSLLAHH